MNDLISRKWLLEEYDRRHTGPRGGAYQMILNAPSVGFGDAYAAIDDLYVIIENDVRPFVSPNDYWLYSRLYDGLTKLLEIIQACDGQTTSCTSDSCPNCGRKLN